MKRRRLTLIALASFMLSVCTGALAKGGGSTTAILNLKAIGFALQIYAHDHDGNLPGALQELVPAYFPDEVLGDPYVGRPFVYIGAGQKLLTNDENLVMAYSSWGGSDGIKLVHAGYVLRDLHLPAEFKRNPVSPEEKWIFWMNHGFLICLVCSIGVAYGLIEWARKKGTIKRVGLVRLVGVLPVLIVTCAAWWIVGFNFAGHAPAGGHSVALTTHYKNLAPQLAAYARDHERRLPDELSDLVPQYLHDTREAISAGQYFGHNKLWADSPAATNEIIVASTDRDGHSYALTNGGEIRQLARGEIQAMISKSPKEALP